MVLSQCNKCGRSENLSYVGGQWWCRNCLFEETFDLNKAIFYVLLNQDTFADRYPYGYSKLWDMFKDGDLRSYYITNSEIDEFISDHLEDYAEWVMTNPDVPTFDTLCEKVRRM